MLISPREWPRTPKDSFYEPEHNKQEKNKEIINTPKLLLKDHPSFAANFHCKN